MIKYTLHGWTLRELFCTIMVTFIVSRSELLLTNNAASLKLRMSNNKIVLE